MCIRDRFNGIIRSRETEPEFYGMRGAAIFGNVSQCGFDGFADIRRNRYRGAEGRNKCCAVNAVITVRQ